MAVWVFISIKPALLSYIPLLLDIADVGSRESLLPGPDDFVGATTINTQERHDTQGTHDNKSYLYRYK